MAELRRLGATVVLANTGRIIIATTKTDHQAAEEYVNFVLTTVTGHPVFKYLQIEPTNYWRQLLFLDEQNYSGIRVDGLDDTGSGEKLGSILPRLPIASCCFLLLPITPSVSYSCADALNTPSSKLSLSPSVPLRLQLV